MRGHILLRYGVAMMYILYSSLFITPMLKGQGKSKSRADALHAEIPNVVSVEIVVHSEERELLIPYCGEHAEAGMKFICGLANKIEIKTKEGWQPVEYRHKEHRVGGLPPSEWKIQRVRAGFSYPFTLMFSKRIYAVEKGQPVRIIVDAWEKEKFMRTRQKTIKLTTPEFECP
jgi:hypothetical protein